MATTLSGTEIPVSVPVNSSEVNHTAKILLEIEFHCATLWGSFKFSTNKSLLCLPTSSKKHCGIYFK